MVQIPSSPTTSYWIAARDSKGHIAELDTPEVVEAWFRDLEATSQSLTLMCGRDEIAEISIDHVDDTETLIEAVIEMPCPDNEFGQTFDEVYTHGDCDVFAVALHNIIGGDLYAVTNPYDDKGERIEDDDYPYLVHAGVYDGDFVYDIRGATGRDYWSQIWRENGGCTMEGETEECDADWLQKCQSTTHTPREIAAATKIAWLIAGLSGALDEAKLEQWRAQRTEPLPLAA